MTTITLIEGKENLGSLVDKQIKKVIPTKSSIVFITEDDTRAELTITSEKVFNAFSFFRFSDIEQLEGQTITQITNNGHTYILQFKDNDNFRHHSIFWVLGIEAIKGVHFSTNLKEMKIHFGSHDGNDYYPIYYLNDGTWHLSEFPEENSVGSLPSLFEEIDLLDHPKVQEVLENHKFMLRNSTKKTTN